MQNDMKALLIGATLLAALSFAGSAAGGEWEEEKGHHFIVYFKGDQNFARDILHTSEKYYERIATELGYPRYKDFWLWDKRVKIYMYPDHKSFLQATGQPDWSQGMADYTNKEIIGYVGSEYFIDSILPHEMAHLIFRDFVGFKGEVPLWIDEGVAQWAEEKRRSAIKAAVRKLYDGDSLLALSDMMQLDIRYVKTDDSLYMRSIKTKKGDDGILFLTGEGLVKTFYAQAASLVGFLIEKYGSESFAFFCRQLRDGKSTEDALKFSYPSYVHNIKEFEKNWRKYIEEGR